MYININSPSSIQLQKIKSQIHPISQLNTNIDDTHTKKMKKIATSMFNFFVIFLILSLCAQSESRTLGLSSTANFQETGHEVRGRSVRQMFKPNPSPTANTRDHQYV